MSNNGVPPTLTGPAGQVPSAPLLATTARHRLLAWPRYDLPADLDVLAREFGPALTGGRDVCLCLRHDRDQDLPLEAASAAVEAAFARALGPEVSLEVLIIDDPLDGAGWVALGNAITGLLALPSAQEGQRRALPSLLGHAPISSGAELGRIVSVAGRPAFAPPQLRTPTSTTAAASAGKPLVSVVVPTFNQPELLQRALGSLARQTFRDFEVLVVNDAGSAVEDWIQAQASPFPITYVRHSANRDRAAARNSALAVAGGRYIAYLNDDDCYRPDHLATLVRELQQGTHKVAYSGQQVKPNDIAIATLMHDRDCLDVVGGFDEGLHQDDDRDFLVRLAARYEIQHVSQVTADVAAPAPATDAAPAREPFLAQLIATYAHPSFGVTGHDEAALQAQRARAAAAELDQRFDNDRAVIAAQLLAAAASPTVALQGERFAASLLAALDVLTAVEAAGSLEQRLHTVQAKVPAPMVTPTSKRRADERMSPSPRAAVVEAILDQLIDVGLVPRLFDRDHIDDIVAIVESRYAGPVNKHRARSQAVRRVLGAVAADNPELPASGLAVALRGVLEPGHPYAPMRGAGGASVRESPRGLSLLAGHEENHHMLLRALVDLRRRGRLTPDAEVLLLGGLSRDELDFFRNELGLPRTTGVESAAELQALPFAAGRFRLVYAAGALSGSSDLRRTVAEIVRVVARPGFVIVSEAADRPAGVDAQARSDSGGIEGLIGLFHDVAYRIIDQDRGRSYDPAVARQWPCLALELLP